MTYVPAILRRFVVERADERCEYCRYPQRAALLAFETEHIIAEKHGGTTTADNLALACPFCNRAKGTDLGSIDQETAALTPFYDPRSHVWEEHFRLEGAEIAPLTAEGRVTVTILQMNHPDRIEERKWLIAAGLYP